MRYIVETDFDRFEPWMGGVTTYDIIRNAYKGEQFENLLLELFPDKLPTDIDINNLLWFDSRFLFDVLEINESEV